MLRKSTKGVFGGYHSRDTNTITDPVCVYARVQVAENGFRSFEEIKHNARGPNGTWAA